MRNKILVLAMAAAGVAFSGTSVAATTQGTVGATSTGTVDINLSIPKLIRITGLANVTLTTAADGDGVYTGAAGSSPACVQSNGSATTYEVTATSANGAALGATPGAFSLVDGASNTVAYSLAWRVDGTPANDVSLAYGTVTASNFVRTAAGLGTCTPQADQLKVSVSAAALNAAVAGSYTDTVTLVVTPD